MKPLKFNNKDDTSVHTIYECTFLMHSHKHQPHKKSNMHIYI